MIAPNKVNVDLPTACGIMHLTDVFYVPALSVSLFSLACTSSHGVKSSTRASRKTANHWTGICYCAEVTKLAIKLKRGDMRGIFSSIEMLMYKVSQQSVAPLGV